MNLEESLWKGGIIIPIKDTIKFLFNLEEEQIETFEQIESKDGQQYFLLVLKRKIEKCPRCNSYNTIIKDYKTNTINSDLIYGCDCNVVFRRRRFICKDYYTLY